MDEYLAETYGDRIADVYDDLYAFPEDTAQAVDFLADLAGDGPVLELGVGTGRIALPLAGRGLTVHGIDASAAMVERLRAKPGGDHIQVTFGDFADVGVEGEYALVFVAFNTLFALLDQDRQVACFTNVARHLLPGGHFVVEAFVPDLGRFDRNQRVGAELVRTDLVQLETSRLDPLQQRVDSAHVSITEDGVRVFPVKIRYAWPSELDLMARLGGLALAQRYGGWAREPVTATSGRLISVYRRAGA
jgi:SAM-dependent methyltransferase